LLMLCAAGMLVTLERRRTACPLLWSTFQVETGI
jgi:hypothetical protein